MLGNTFSTTEGVAFEWQFLTEDCSDSVSQTVISSPFVDSPYNAPEAIYALEKQHQQGEMVLIYPKVAGRTCIKAYFEASVPVTCSATLNTLTIVNTEQATAVSSSRHDCH